MRQQEKIDIMADDLNGILVFTEYTEKECYELAQVLVTQGYTCPKTRPSVICRDCQDALVLSGAYDCHCPMEVKS